MKFAYSYKTSDGVRHEARFEAKTKEEVFAALRKTGVRPIKVWPLEKQISKRNVAICALVIVVFSLAVALVMRRADEGLSERIEADRHQIYGDPAILESIWETGFVDVFEDEGDRFLARYAIPGVIWTRGGAVPLAALEGCVSRPHVLICKTDVREIVELKQIVNGIRRELREYCEAGGEVRDFVRELNNRQRDEFRLYRRIRDELANTNDADIWDERNATLRAMGLRTIARPKKDEKSEKDFAPVHNP